MGIKKYGPYTPSRRHMTGSDFSEITKKTPEKSLLVSKNSKAGRNNQGKITVRHHGGGGRVKYRIVDFRRNKDDMPAKVIGIEYDPNRTANIALIEYEDGTKSYIIAPQGLKDGMTVMNGPHAEVRIGNCLPLSEIPIGESVGLSAALLLAVAVHGVHLLHLGALEHLLHRVLDLDLVGFGVHIKGVFLIAHGGHALLRHDGL